MKLAGAYFCCLFLVYTCPGWLVGLHDGRQQDDIGCVHAETAIDGVLGGDAILNDSYLA